jgi:hypothetical protein
MESEEERKREPSAPATDDDDDDDDVGGGRLGEPLAGDSDPVAPSGSLAPLEWSEEEEAAAAARKRGSPWRAASPGERRPVRVGRA